MVRLRALIPYAFALAAAVTSCRAEDTVAPPRCTSASIEANLEALAVGTVRIRTDRGLDAHAIEQDLISYLHRMWGVELASEEANGPPDGSEVTIWLTTSAAGRNAAGKSADGGYVLRRVGRTLLVYADDPRSLAHGSYALLEELGARFFHPMQEHVPELGGIFVPAQLEVSRRPAFAVRGLQFHLLHPIEYFASFLEPSEEHFREAGQVIDWLVKTGQNHLQWWLLDTVDWDRYAPYARRLLDYAHARGVTVAAVVQLSRGLSLQNARALVQDPAKGEEQLAAGIDRIMQVPWDGIELALGEFLASDPEALVRWLDHGTRHMADRYPRATLSIVNHVGTGKNLYVPFRGKTEYFYFLPRFADARLTNTVHTLAWFDLYRDWGMYGHPHFFEHRAFLFEELGKRPMRYMPESAYWTSLDIDVPAFLPDYIRARHIDISRLVQDVHARGLPAVQGHVMFSSGHEWGYWMTDYLAAKMMWQPEGPLEDRLRDVTNVFGSCAGELQTAFEALLQIETAYLFDARLMPYISGEDQFDDFGDLAGTTTQPPRVPFDTVGRMQAEARAKFERDVVDKLEELARKLAPIVQAIREVCKGSDAALGPWCRELEHGADIVRLRARHSAHLYRAILLGDATHLRAAEASRQEAAEIVAYREREYRFSLDRLTAAYANPTIYKFGYLRQAHTLCLWRRQEQQARTWLEQATKAGPFDLEACLD